MYISRADGPVCSAWKDRTAFRSTQAESLSHSLLSITTHNASSSKNVLREAYSRPCGRSMLPPAYPAHQVYVLDPCGFSHNMHPESMGAARPLSSSETKISMNIMLILYIRDWDEICTRRWCVLRCLFIFGRGLPGDSLPRPPRCPGRVLRACGFIEGTLAKDGCSVDGAAPTGIFGSSSFREYIIWSRVVENGVQFDHTCV